MFKGKSSVSDSGAGSGNYVRALVTLPCVRFRSEVYFKPIQNSSVVLASPAKTKAVRAAELTLKHLGLSGGGTLEFAAEIPSGFGYGSSSADVLAVIEAIAASAGVSIGKEQAAVLAVYAEAAVDPLLWGNRAVLWAQREGYIVEDFGVDLPPVTVLGFSLGESIDTLNLPLPQYTDSELRQFEELRQRLRAALPGDVAEIAKIATASATINNRYLPRPRFEKLLDLCKEAGLPGLQISHSGSAAGLFLPHAAVDAELLELLGVRLRELGVEGWALFGNSPCG